MEQEVELLRNGSCEELTIKQRSNQNPRPGSSVGGRWYERVGPLRVGCSRAVGIPDEEGVESAHSFFGTYRLTSTRVFNLPFQTFSSYVFAAIIIIAITRLLVDPVHSCSLLPIRAQYSVQLLPPPDQRPLHNSPPNETFSTHYITFIPPAFAPSFRFLT